jgi:hypothetical protein
MRSLRLVHSRHVRNVFKDGLPTLWAANPKKGLHQTMSLFRIHLEIGIRPIEIVDGNVRLGASTHCGHTLTVISLNFGL